MVRSIPLAAVAFALLAGCGDGTDPAATAEPRLPSGDVRIVVDGLGISHVYAQSDADAFFGAGWAMARDRLFQMEVFRRRAAGRMAELFGDARAKDDVGARTFGFARLGAADLARLRAERPADALLFDAWTAGVNARIAEVRSGAAPVPYGLGPAELGHVPEPWGTEEAFAVGKLLSFGMSSTIDYELLATAIRRVAPDFASRYPVLMPTFDTFTMPGEVSAQRAARPPPVEPPPAGAPHPGDVPSEVRWLSEPLASNNWAVDAAHSATGRPLLAGDPHQSLTSPSRFWPVHVSSIDGGGTLDVIGFSFAGTPVVELGHGGRVAWTATTNYADVMDFWDVTLDAERKNALLGDGSHPVVARTETIRVRRAGAAYGDADDQEIVIEEVTGHGVLLPDQVLPLPRSFFIDGSAVMFAWTGLRPTLESAAYLEMGRARDLDEWIAAADLLEVGAANFVAADERDIALHVHASVPDRGPPASHAMPWRILPGSDAASFWTRGDLPAERFPHRRNPSAGFIATANNDPWGFTADGDVENDPFYFGAYYANGFRAHRIEEALSALLDGGAKVTHADMEALQRDTHSPMADTLLPHLADAIGAIGADPALAPFEGRADLLALAAALAAWDRSFDVAAGEPVAFIALEWFAARAVVEAPLTKALFDAIASKSPPFIIGALRNVLEDRFEGAPSFVPQGRRTLMLSALDETAAWLEARFGTKDLAEIALGDVHAAVFPSVYPGRLEVGRFPVGGHLDTINVSPAPFFSGGDPRDELSSSEMSLYRMVVSFGDDGVAEASVDFARGAREDPDDPHFGDQQELWRVAGHVPLPFRRGDVEAQATEEITLPAAR